MSTSNPKFTDVQVKGFSKIMIGLPEQGIFDLVNSVTKKSIKVYSFEEAFEAIISFSASPEELLHRKKISRDILLQYAFNEKICIVASAEKKEIVSKILEHWNKVQLSSPVSVCSSQHQNKTDRTLHFQQENKVNTVACHETINSGDFSKFGHNFVSWFYKMLNSHNQQMNASAPLDFGPQHFWPDSTLQVNTMKDATIMGAASVAERLLQFAQGGLYFHANLIDGVSIKMESHGSICVLVHGMVHKGENCFGPFEQAFTLLQDPSTGNNWKIKNIWLNVHCTSNTNTSYCIEPG